MDASHIGERPFLLAKFKKKSWIYKYWKLVFWIAGVVRLCTE